MGSSITIANTDNWAKAFLEQQPTEINGMEPAVSSASLVVQTVLGPPFAWPWNRSVLNFTTSTQDFQFTGLSNFGFLEGGSIAPASGGKSMELLVKNILQQEANQARAIHVSPLLDDGAGNITFRLSMTPDQSYVVSLMFQNRAPLIQSMGSTWAPIPDDKNYICQWGYLALMSLIGNDARFNEYNSKFITSVLAAQGGLTELERSIWLSNWMRVMSQLQSNQLATGERYKARET